MSSDNSSNNNLDPFDPANLRLGQNFAHGVGVKKCITRVPTRKPNRHEFVRVAPGDENYLETAILEDKANRESYLVEKALWGELAGEIVPAALFFAINRQNDVFLWPCKLPGLDGKTNAWNETALDAAKLAQEAWVRVVSNMQAGQYDIYQAEAKLAEPVWPELTFREALKKAFQDRFIRDMEHPFLRALRGEV